MASKGTLRVRILGDAGPLQKTIDGLGSTFSKFATLAAGAGVAAGVALTKGLVDSLNMEQANDRLAAQLGLTAQESERFGRIAGNLYADAYGESLEQVNQALAAVESSLGDTLDGSEQQLEDVTAKALDFASAFEVDVNRAVGSARVLIESGLARDVDHAMDLMTASMQEVPAQLREDLLDATDEYGQFFSQLGFDAEQTFGALVAAAEDGTFELDKTGDALKELTIRATDMSTASVEAYEAAGLSAEDMAGRFIEGGDEARGALADLVDGLQSIDDPVERANAAIALFGTPIEDLGVQQIPEFLDQLDGMGRSLQDVEGASGRMGDTLNDNLGTRIEALKRQGLMALAEIAERVLVPALEQVVGFIERNVGPTVARLQEWWEESGPAIMDVLEDVRDTVVDVFDTVSDVISDAIEFAQDLFGRFQSTLSDNESDVRSWLDTAVDIFNQVRDTVESAMTAVRTVIETAVTVISAFWERFGSHIADFAARSFGRMLEAIQDVLEILQGIFDTVTAVLSGDWSGAMDAMTDVTNAAMDFIGDRIDQFFDTLKTAFGAVVAVVSQIWSGLWSAIRGMAVSGANAAIGIVEGLLQQFRNAFQWIRNGFQGIRNIADKIPGVDIADIPNLPDVNLGRISGPATLPEAPNRAAGGGVFHSGGMVSASLPRWPGLASDERVGILKTGEWITPRGGTPPGRGMTVVVQGNVYGVDDLRRVVQESLREYQRANTGTGI